MADNGAPIETKQGEQQDMQHQQQDLFEELSYEQAQAEAAIEKGQEWSAKEGAQATSDE